MVSYLWDLDRRAARYHLYPLVLGLLGLCVFSFWYAVPPNIPSLVPDSSSYLNFQAFRGAGYPLFLDAIRLFDRELIGIQYYQLGLLISSLCFLGYSVRCFTDSAIAGVLIVIGAGLHPLYIRYCFTVLSEPLFFSSLNVFVAFQLRRNLNSKFYWAATGALLAWLVLIKGAAWALLCVPAVMLLNQIFQKNKPTSKPIFRNVVFLLTGFAIVTSSGMIYRYANHGTTATESFMGNQLVGKFSLMSVDPQKTSYPVPIKYWQQELADTIEVKNKYFSDNWDYQFLFSLNYYDYLRFRQADKMLELSGSNLSRPDFQSRLASELLMLATREYLKDVAVNFYVLWTQGELQTPAFAAQYNDQLNITSELMPNSQSPYYLGESGQTAAYIIKPFLYFSFLLNIAYIFYGVRYWLRAKEIPSHITPLFVIAVAIQSYYLLVALLQAGLVRYMMPIWPLLLLSTLIGATTLIEKFFASAAPEQKAT